MINSSRYTEKFLIKYRLLTGNETLNLIAIEILSSGT